MPSPKQLLTTIGLVTFLVIPPNALAELCNPKTRCRDYEKCFINGVQQPCAYGSGGARYGGIIFKHGIFNVEWLSETRAKVAYGKHKEFKTYAQIADKNGYRVFRLSDGVVIKLPESGGKYAGG
jgi:hypothetical protein